MLREEQIDVWANAYNAALTGLLASKIYALDEAGTEQPWIFGPKNVQVITKQCKALADQALEDVRKFEKTGFAA